MCSQHHNLIAFDVAASTWFFNLYSDMFLKLFLDAKASADTLLDLCMLHIQVNSKQQLYICYWSWYTNWVNWFHPASVRIFSKYLAIQNGKKSKLQCWTKCRWGILVMCHVLQTLWEMWLSTALKRSNFLKVNVAAPTETRINLRLRCSFLQTCSCIALMARNEHFL